MSAQAQRNGQPLDNDFDWLEFPDHFETSAASVWAIDYEEEITIQSKRVAAQEPQQLTADTGDEPSDVEARPRALTLDESQVLPSEASFATVKLHQQFEATAVDRREQLTTWAVEESTENSDSSRTRRLDISHVLPGEVSYATVRLQTGDRKYSPLREFFGTSNSDSRKLVVEALLLVSISLAIAIVTLKIANPHAFSSNVTVSDPAVTSRSQTEPTLVQTEMPRSDSETSVAVSNRQIEVNDHAASAPENAAKVEAALEVASNDSNVALNSEGSRKAAADEIRLKISRKAPQQEGKSSTRNSASVVERSKPGQTTQQLRPSVKESKAGIRATPKESVGVDNRSQAVEPRRESSSFTNATSGQPKAAATSAPVTGGAQRPRTVTPKATP